jgi:hypothetical protein
MLKNDYSEKKRSTLAGQGTTSASLCVKIENISWPT